MGHDDLRLMPAVQLGHPLQHLVLSQLPVGVLRAFAVGVPESAELRIVPDAEGPKPVQRLASAGRIAPGKIGHHDPLPLFRRVGRNRAAQEDQLIVRMRGEEQNIRLFLRRFPSLHPVRDFSLPEYKHLVEADLLAFLSRGEDADGLFPVQRVEGMLEPGLPLRQGHPVLLLLLRGLRVFSQHLDFIAFRHLPPAEIQPVHRRFGADGDPGIPNLVALPVGGILPVRHQALVPFGRAQPKGACAGQIRSLRRQGRPGQQQDRCGQQHRGNHPFFHALVPSFFSSSVLFRKGGAVFLPEDGSPLLRVSPSLPAPPGFPRNPDPPEGDARRPSGRHPPHCPHNSASVSRWKRIPRSGKAAVP